MKSRKGLTPVVASVILSGMVLVIGAGVWSYSYGAASSMAQEYSEITIDMVHTITERYCIEKVHFDSGTENIHIWIYNYGNIPIEVEVTATVNGNQYSDPALFLGAKVLDSVAIDLSAESLGSLDEVIISVISDRSNQEYWTYYVP